MALEAIELIVKEKAAIERSPTIHSALNTSMYTSNKTATSWKSCQSIYKYLSHHYILKRSIVFIVDSQFDSVIFRDKVQKYVRDFFDGMDEEDYFGYISLDQKGGLTDEITLEKKGSNPHIKRRLLRDISEREADYVISAGNRQNEKRTIRLESALEKAYEWQNTLVQDFEKTVNNKVYVGPLKWIVCLLGDDVYSVN
mmetsp:Transcript_4884/g.5959  ORF Transcript_4884/g.5959 Transcript_4884/m.5959 type:complete len:198 (+) Transcript_4884:1357-1950(+)